MHQVHIIESHVVEFIKLKGEVAGLGFWSEQGMETGHFEFKEEWGKVKLPTSHTDYRENLEKTLFQA